MGGNGTHDVGMMETLEDLHFALHPLLVPLDLLLRNGLQCDIAHDVGRLGGVIMRGRVDGGRVEEEIEKHPPPALLRARSPCVSL